MPIPCRFDRSFRSWWLLPLYLGGHSSKNFDFACLSSGLPQLLFVLPSSGQEHFFFLFVIGYISFRLIPNCLGPVPLAVWWRVHGLFPMILPQTSFKVWEGGKFSGSYGIVPMKWVAQLNDIRFSLPEFRGRSPTLILMLYSNDLYVYCPSQSSVQDLSKKCRVTL